MKNFNTKYKIQNTKYTSGYTFIELIIVIAIFSIISSVVLFNSGSFSSNISLQNTTADIALQIKEAQSDAISGRLNDAINLFGDKYYRPTYGIVFQKNNTEFTKFVDLPVSQNWVFDKLSSNCDSSSPECLKIVKINGFDYISDIRVGNVGDSPSDYISIDDSDVLNVSFQRPFPDAIIAVEDNGVIAIYNIAEIILTSTKSGNRKIIINAAGSIAIEQVQ